MFVLTDPSARLPAGSPPYTRFSPATSIASPGGVPLPCASKNVTDLGRLRKQVRTERIPRGTLDHHEAPEQARDGLSPVHEEVMSIVRRKAATKWAVRMVGVITLATMAAVTATLPASAADRRTVTSFGPTEGQAKYNVVTFCRSQGGRPIGETSARRNTSDSGWSASILCDFG
jgi:hypothetical protein